MPKPLPILNETPLAPTSYVTFFSPLDPEQHRRAAEVFGYLELGLPELAISVFGGVGAPIQARSDLEVLRLLALEQAGTPMEVMGELAWQSLAQHPTNFRLLEMACLHLTGAEQYDRVLQLYERHRASWMMTGNLLQMATAAAANLGRFKLALELGVQTAAGLITPSDVLMDSQILPLWTRYAVAPLDAEEGALLRSPELSEMLASAQAGPPPSGICPFTLKHLLPKVFHPWMQPCPDAACRPQPGTPKAIRLAFFHWQDSRRRRNLRLLRRAIQRAHAQLPRHPRLRSPSGQTLGC